MNSTVSRAEFDRLIREGVPIADVRAPVEFHAGSLPNSVNLPILDDEERHRVGLAYKTRGPEAAVDLGHELVRGGVRAERTARWVDFARNHPRGVFTCFRGGLRSQTAQAWLKQEGFSRPLIEGGYKAMRHHLLGELEGFSRREVVLIGGATGAGKSLVLHNLDRPSLDLEGLAHHRGSAFGRLDEPQPSQIDFEHRLAAALVARSGSPARLVLEDEGSLIGRCALPRALSERMKISPLVVVDEDLGARAAHTYDTYIGTLSDGQLELALVRYRQALLAISRKLGGLRYREASADFEAAVASGSRENHRGWIEKILLWYYDPLYLRNLQARRHLVEFRGARDEVRAYLHSGV